MEIKINREIRAYQESVVMGLSLRQLFCSVLAVIAAVGVFFSLQGVLHREIVTWLCILAAAPIGAMGFIQYNGMTLEQLALAWVRSEFICAGVRKYEPENLYWQALYGDQSHQIKVKR